MPKMNYADLETTTVGVGFEPTVPRTRFDTPVYQTGAINQTLPPDQVSFVAPAGLEPATRTSQKSCSIHLSYGAIQATGSGQLPAAVVSVRTISQTTWAFCFSGRRAYDGFCLRSADFPRRSLKMCAESAQHYSTLHCRLRRGGRLGKNFRQKESRTRCFMQPVLAVSVGTRS